MGSATQCFRQRSGRSLPSNVATRVRKKEHASCAEGTKNQVERKVSSVGHDLDVDALITVVFCVPHALNLVSISTSRGPLSVVFVLGAPFGEGGASIAPQGAGA